MLAVEPGSEQHDATFSGSLANRVVAGKYRILSYLASGGVGAVYSAEHVELGERVAIKFLSSQWASDHAIAERFLREARTQFKIGSENVTRVIDVGRTDWGTAYLVMELVEGETVRDLVDRIGAVEPDYAAEVVRQASLGLAAAHELGVVHRDVKGSNMMLTDRNGKACVKVLDFGLAGVRSAIQGRVRESRLTPSSLVMGTPLYMAPEQLKGARHATPRSDIWSSGVILYELLTGVKPFDLVALARCLHGDALPDIVAASKQRPGIPPPLCAIVQRCLSRVPDERFSDGADLARALAPFARPFRLADLVRLEEPPPISRSRGLSRATTKVASDDGHTAFEVHELVELRTGSFPDAIPLPPEVTELKGPRELESTMVRSARRNEARHPEWHGGLLASARSMRRLAVGAAATLGVVALATIGVRSRSTPASEGVTKPSVQPSDQRASDPRQPAGAPVITASVAPPSPFALPATQGEALSASMLEFGVTPPSPPPRLLPDPSSASAPSGAPRSRRPRRFASPATATSAIPSAAPTPSAKSFSPYLDKW